MSPSWVRQWKLWQLPAPARWYICAVSIAGAAALMLAAAFTHWHTGSVTLFVSLLACGALSVEATRDASGEPSGTLFWDMMPVWYQTVAIVLSPFYAILAPCLLIALKQLRVMRSPWHRRMLSAAAVGMPYGAVSLAFHAIPLTATGPASGGTTHALAWAAAATGCGLAAMVLNDALVIPAILFTDQKARLRTLLTSREALPVNLIQLSLGSLISLAVAASPFLMLLALPSVLLQRRYLMHAQLLAAARTDPKTGLLNSAAWERQAGAELSRARRSGASLAIALVDIDHFKQVNDTWDHLTGDRVLCAVAAAVSGTLRDYDLCCRFGGEEFAIALPGTSLADAAVIAERIRTNVAALAVPARDNPHAPKISVTISIGLTAFTPDAGDPVEDITTLLATADHALYQAKDAGRNRVHTSPLTGLTLQHGERDVGPPLALEHGQRGPQLQEVVDRLYPVQVTHPHGTQADIGDEPPYHLLAIPHGAAVEHVSPPIPEDRIGEDIPGVGAERTVDPRARPARWALYYQAMPALATFGSCSEYTHTGLVAPLAGFTWYAAVPSTPQTSSWLPLIVMPGSAVVWPGALVQVWRVRSGVPSAVL